MRAHRLTYAFSAAFILAVLWGCAPPAGQKPAEGGGPAKSPDQGDQAPPPAESAGTSPLAVDKQLALLKEKDTGKGAFTLVVLGDNRTGGDDPVAQPAVYHKIVEEISGLDHVSFVIDVGDLIAGYARDDGVVNRMWDEFEKVSLKISKPFLVVPGNHDVEGGNQEKIYGERFGKFHYAFDFKGARFIVLDSDDQRRPDFILPDQLAWLKQQLEDASGADIAPVFVFFHKPMWQYAEGQSNWTKEVHPLLAEHKVAAVFAGHEHIFVDHGEKDGVHYYITGGAGAPLAKGGELTGSFYHYMEITIADDRSWTASVYKPGRTMVSTDLISPDKAGKLTKWSGELLAAPLSLDELPIEVQVPVENPLDDTTLSFSFTWEYPETAWKIEPREASFELIPGGKKDLIFTLSPGIPKFPFPVPSLSLLVSKDGEEVISTRKPLSLNFIRTAKAGRLAEQPAIDGKLEDAWQKAGKISGFLTDDGAFIANPPTVVYAGYDDDSLYLSFICYEGDPGAIRTDRATVRDGDVWKDDSIEVFITSPADKSIYYHFLVSAAGVQQDETGRGGAWDGKWQAAAQVDREGKRWIIEMAVPASDLGVRSLSRIESIRVNFARNRYVGKAQSSVWNCTFGSYHKPELFGELLLAR